MTVPVMISIFLVLLVAGVPLAFAMGLAAIVAVLTQTTVPGLLLPQLFFNSLDHFALLAVPLFVLAGEFMSRGGITERIVDLSRALMGHLRGGFAQANVLTNMFMAAISGSSLADLSAIGSMMIPAMKSEGYRPQFAVAVTACAAMMAPIIPPSIIAVIYGSITGVSIGGLFLGGAIPGVIAGLGMLTITWYQAVRQGMPKRPRASMAEVGGTALLAIPALIMPIIIIGGIISGAFTPTEAGAVAVIYGLGYGVLARRHGVRSLYRNLIAATETSAAALINLGGAALFSWVLARAGVADTVLAGLMSVTTDPIAVLFIIIGFLVLLGMFLEVVPALILTVPVLHPIGERMAYDPLHFGIIVLMTLTVGSVTPPVGILGMVAARIGGIAYSSIFRDLMPYVLLWIIVIVLIVFVPELVTWLPSVVL